MNLLIIGIIVFVVGSYWDIDYSELVKNAGGDEWNVFLRDHNKKFLAIRALILHAVVLALILVAHFNWIPIDQQPYTAIGLGGLGILSLAVAFGVDRPLYKKLLKTNVPPVQAI